MSEALDFVKQNAEGKDLSVLPGSIKWGVDSQIVFMNPDNGEITTEAVPVGPQLIVKAQDKIDVGDPLTNDPNVGGFGLLDAEVVLQSPYRVIGLIAFFIGVGLTQILLVL